MNILHCLVCKKEFKPSKLTQKYCSHSCANIAHPKRCKTKQCKICKTKIESSYTFCDQCITEGKHLRNGKKIENKTLAEMTYNKNDANRYCAIRGNARLVVKYITKCQKCNYSLHTEVCHIKPINEFDMNTKISEINNPDNLLVLCRNHHWEFDNGFLTAEEIKKH
jgi:hypothetical protein